MPFPLLCWHLFNAKWNKRWPKTQQKPKIYTKILKYLFKNAKNSEILSKNCALHVASCALHVARPSVARCTPYVRLCSVMFGYVRLCSVMFGYVRVGPFSHQRRRDRHSLLFFSSLPLPPYQPSVISIFRRNVKLFSHALYLKSYNKHDSCYGNVHFS